MHADLEQIPGLRVPKMSQDLIGLGTFFVWERPRTLPSLTSGARLGRTQSARAGLAHHFQDLLNCALAQRPILFNAHFLGLLT